MTSVRLEANSSGRLWTDDPAAWDRLCSPDGCPMCAEPDMHPEWMLAETESCYVFAWREAPLPGYVLVTARRHVVEPFELPEAEQSTFFIDAMRTARGLARLVAPVKMNYEIHGNTVPHLHLHLFPRTPGDVYVGYPNHCRAVFSRTDEQIDQMRQVIRTELAERLLG